MEENKKDQVDITKNNKPVDSEMFDFGYLINIILDYYCPEEDETNESGERWKKGTDYDLTRKIPKEVDKAVGEAFQFQLKKFYK